MSPDPVSTDPVSTEADPATLGYEQARDELLLVVQRLESGGVPLEDSLALWERGEALADRCQEWLDGARERLDAARGGTDPDGEDDDDLEDDDLEDDDLEDDEDA